MAWAAVFPECPGPIKQWLAEAESEAQADIDLFVDKLAAIGATLVNYGWGPVVSTTATPPGEDADDLEELVWFDSEEGDSTHDHLFATTRHHIYQLHKTNTGSWGHPGMLPPVREESYSWSAGDGLGFQVRNSCRNGRIQKAPAEGSMYECISVDIVKSSCKVSEVLHRLVEMPPQAVDSGSDETWWPGCPLPRVLCIVIQIPYERGPTLFGEHPANDHGCSILTLHRIKPATLRLLRSGRRTAAVSLFAKFVSGETTHLVGGNRSSGLLKAIAVAGNVEAIGVPQVLLPTVRKFNGKPVVITRSGTVFRDASGEWLELDVDIRFFCSLARSVFVSLRGLLPRTSVHCGFTIQGCEDHELPEGIVADAWIHNIDLVAHARHIDDPPVTAMPKSMVQS